jgi:hypothetical protein
MPITYEQLYRQYQISNANDNLTFTKWLDKFYPDRKYLLGESK